MARPVVTYSKQSNIILFNISNLLLPIIFGKYYIYRSKRLQ